jgi:hypothetical protein
LRNKQAVSAASLSIHECPGTFGMQLLKAFAKGMPTRNAAPKTLFTPERPKPIFAYQRWRFRGSRAHFKVIRRGGLKMLIIDEVQKCFAGIYREQRRALTADPRPDKGLLHRYLAEAVKLAALSGSRVARPPAYRGTQNDVSYHIVVEGDPTFDFEMSLPTGPRGLLATGLHLVNEIPPVVKSAPGILDVATLSHLRP